MFRSIDIVILASIIKDVVVFMKQYIYEISTKTKQSNFRIMIIEECVDLVERFS